MEGLRWGAVGQQAPCQVGTARIEKVCCGQERAACLLEKQEQLMQWAPVVLLHQQA